MSGIAGAQSDPYFRNLAQPIKPEPDDAPPPEADPDDVPMPNAQQYVAMANPPLAAAPVATLANQSMVNPQGSGSINVRTAVPIQGPSAPLAPFGSGYGDAKQNEESAKQDFAAVARDANEAAKAQQQAINLNADVMAQKQDAEQSIRERQLADDQRLAAKKAQYQAAYEQSMGAQQQGLDNILQSVGAAPFDPNRYIKNRSAGESFLSAIAIGLGSIGQGINGARNPAQDMLQRAIEGDVDQQRVQYERGMANYHEQENAYARARDAGMNHSQAMDTARLAQWKNYDQQVAVVGGRYGGQQADANRQKLLADSAGEQAKLKQGLVTQYHTTATALAGQTQAVRSFAASRSDESFKRDTTRSELAIKAMEAEGKGSKQYVIPGWTGGAASPDAYTKATGAVATEKILTRKVQEMADYARNSIAGKSTLSEMATVASTAAQVKVALKDKFQLGVMSASDEKLLDSVAGDPSKVNWTPATIAQLDHLIQQTQMDTNDTLETYGFTRNKGDKRFKVDAHAIEGGSE